MKKKLMALLLAVAVVGMYSFGSIGSVFAEDTTTPSIELDNSSATLYVGNTTKLTATVKNADGATVVWKSSDEKVATVSDGTVTGVAEGTATVTATAQKDGAEVASTTASVTVASNKDSEGSTVEVSNPKENSGSTQDVKYAQTEADAAKGSDMSYNIGENASGTQTIDFGNDFIGAWDTYGYIMPGDGFGANIGITNSSKHTYQIDAGSLTVSTLELKDSQKIATIPNNALMELFGKDGSSFTLSDLSNSSIAAQLKKVGFDGDLFDYYLQYYNKKYNTNATNLYDLPLAARNDIMGSGNQTYSNGLFKITAEEKAELEKDTNNLYRFTENKDGTYDVQAVSSDSRLTDMKYLHLLGQCLQMDVTGSEWSDFKSTLRSGSNVQNGTTEYLNNSAVYQNAVKYLSSVNGGDINKASSDAAYVFAVFAGLNGPNTGNAFMNYAFGLNMSIQAKQIDGSVTVTKKTSDGGAAKASFKLYYKVDGSDNYKYYKLNEDGTVSWVDDQNDATMVETDTTGATTIDYLMPGYQYYLQEKAVAALSGNSSDYDVYNDPIAFQIASNSTTSVNVTDTVKKETPTPPTPVVQTTSYNVVANYYTSTDGGEFVKDNASEVTLKDATTVNVGDTITATLEDSWMAYNGNKYGLDESKSTLTKVAVLDRATNTLTLNYYRSVKNGSDDPDNNNKHNGGGSSDTPKNNNNGGNGSSTGTATNANTPDTGDSMDLVLWSMLGVTSIALAGVVLALRRKEQN